MIPKKLSKTILIVLLLGALMTYVAPFMSVSFARVGSIEFSFNDLVRLIPLPDLKEKKSGPEINFKETLEKITELRPSAKKSEGGFQIAPELIFGGMIPVALAIAYISALLSLLFVVIGSGLFLRSWLLGGVLASAYVIFASQYLSSFVKNRVAESGEGIIGLVSGLFSKGISVETEYGAYVLTGCLAAAFLFYFLRKIFIF